MKDTEMKMSLEGLKKFCSTDESRPELADPFSMGAWTYATDGRVIVRVPRLEEVALREAVSLKSIEELGGWSGEGLAGWRGVPEDLPETPIRVCPDCEGGGEPGFCDYCEGEKRWEAPVGIDFGVRRVSEMYLRRLKDLPGIELAAGSGGEQEAMFFRFEGGCGYLMPMRKDDGGKAKG